MSPHLWCQAPFNCSLVNDPQDKPGLKARRVKIPRILFQDAVCLSFVFAIPPPHTPVILGLAFGHTRSRLDARPGRYLPSLYPAPRWAVTVDVCYIEPNLTCEKRHRLVTGVYLWLKIGLIGNKTRALLAAVHPVLRTSSPH